MEFIDDMPVFFKEIIPNHNVPDRWKEITLNTGGTHSTLQDIKIPQKAGGYWYRDSEKANTRNRFINWQTTPDSIELTETSLDVNLSGAHLKCKVAPGTPPLNGISAYERVKTNEVVILAATVSSVHRFVFPHPRILDKKSTFGSLSISSPSIFTECSAVNSPNNYYILTQYFSPTSGVAHSCSTLLRDNGDAVFALAFGYGGDGGLLLVKLPVSGSPVTTVLKRESTVPRFLSGITGALRGKSSDNIETHGVVLTNGLAVAICGDTCLRAWQIDERGTPHAISPPLSQTTARPRPLPHGHMLQKTEAPDGSVLLVAYLSFPNECEFVVIKIQQDFGGGNIKFSHICRIYGPELDLVDYEIGYGGGGNVLWALWSQPDGDTVITSSDLGAEVCWRAVAGREPPAPLPQLTSHQQYRDKLLTPGLFPASLIHKALVIYRRTWGNNETNVSGDLGEAAMGAVQARLRHLAARMPTADQLNLMHKCWSELYSWCMQYMEGLQKPLGLIVSKHKYETQHGWWCGVVRRAGVSLVRELETLERIMLCPVASRIDQIITTGLSDSELSTDALRVVAAGARWERAVGASGAAELERRLFTSGAPQHRLLPRLLHLQQASAPEPHADRTLPTLSPKQVDELSTILEPIGDLQNAVLELNDALRLDVPDVDLKCDDDDDEFSEYKNLFASDLGVSIVTESIRQMAEMRSRIVRGALAALGAARGSGGVPGAGHCAVHWQAYRALLWLRNASLQRVGGGPSETFQLKLQALGVAAVASAADIGTGVGGAVGAYCAGAGGRRARTHLAHARSSLRWEYTLPLMTYHLAHQLWAVSGGFEFGWWLACINQPRLVQNYVTMLEPWCEWNACSRQFILGLSLLELNDAESAYTAFSKAAKGVSSEPFLRQLVTGSESRLTQHRALVLYYMKVIKLFEIHEAGACVIRLVETAISIADKDDPNLPMFQWLMFKWHLSGGRVSQALSAACGMPSPSTRAAATTTLLTTLVGTKQLSMLVSCGALTGEAERAANSRAKLHDALRHNPYYDFLYALHVSRHHYRKAAAVMYERAARCAAECVPDDVEEANLQRRRWLAAALTCLRLARPEHAYLARPEQHSAQKMQVLGPEELAAELRAEDVDSLDPVQKALRQNDIIDFNYLYTQLKEADTKVLSDVTKRAITTNQFLPRWFLLKYLELDSAGCIRALLSGGRVTEAGEACCVAIRVALQSLSAHAPPAAAPLALADLLLAELQHSHSEVYEDLNNLVKTYTDTVKRISEDMKMAKLGTV